MNKLTEGKSKSMKVRIISTNFGEFPNYFQLWLNSCAYNTKFEWLIFTDNRTPYRYPDNVEVVYMSFTDIQKHVQSKFDFPISFERPYRFCVFKPAYGEIFQEYLEGYDIWGHCDLDTIFGNLEPFLPEPVLKKYDKIFGLGHLSLYKNTPEVNKRYKLPLNGNPIYIEYMSQNSTKGIPFDEWGIGSYSIVDIYLAYNIPFYLARVSAEPHSWYSNFRLTDYWYGKVYSYPSTDNIFHWDKGVLTRIYLDNGEIKREEFGYIHLQKRPMSIEVANTEKEFYLVPNCFISADEEITSEMIQKYSKNPLIDRQYLKTRSNNLKVKIKHRLLLKGKG